MCRRRAACHRARPCHFRMAVHAGGTGELHAREPPGCLPRKLNILGTAPYPRRVTAPSVRRRSGVIPEHWPSRDHCRQTSEAAPDRRIGVGSAIQVPVVIDPSTKGVAIPTVIGHHDVKDRDHWLASPKREEFFGPLGVTNIRTFIDPTNPTRVAVLMDVADMDALAAAMETPAAGEAMAHDGVLPETLVMLVEA